MLATSVKHSINRAYLLYKDHFPVQRGKYRVGWALHRAFGHASYVSGGLKYELSPVTYIDEKLIRGDMHDAVVTEQLQAHAGPGDCVVDIGANIGIFSLQASRLVGPEGRVYAFEPSPREFVRLLRHIELNECENVVPIASGISETVQDSLFHLAWLGNTGQNSLFRPETVERTVRCGFGPLGAFLPEEILPRIKVIKIDVEGAEAAVLRGAASIMPKLTNAVFVVEIAQENLERSGESAEAIYGFFAQHGYRPLFGMSPNVRDDVFVRVSR
jgi:FkbM family methyltransferase